MNEEVKKILDEALQRCQSPRSHEVGDWSPRDVQELIIKVKETLNEFESHDEAMEAELAWRSNAEKVEFGLSVHEAAITQANSECQQKVERIFKEIGSYLGFDIVEPEDLPEWWQALKK